MKEVANYIKSIEIESLWNGKKHVKWNLNPGVNILSGVNGVGKSTILNRVIMHLLNIDKLDRQADGVKLEYDVEGAHCVDFDVIRSFDRPVLSGDIMKKVTDTQLQTELDFQVTLSNQMVELFTKQDPQAQEKAQQLAQEKAHFQDVVDSLFKDTGKTILRDKNELYFDSFGETLSPYKLSSGEKQMLIILLSVLVQNKRHYTLFMDEPEVSLHVEWQQQLVSLIRDLNPNAQIILTTHSPAVIMNGWADCVTDVEDIVS